MPLDVPDLPEKFARLQQQLVLTEVELMKLEDLRDELRTREAAAQSLVRELQGIADRALAARDHRAGEAAAAQAALQQAREQLAAVQARATGLDGTVASLQTALTLQKEHSAQLAATIAAMESSLGWKLTSPLRAIGRLFGRRA